jgi:hypothetical protein
MICFFIRLYINLKVFFSRFQSLTLDMLKVGFCNFFFINSFRYHDLNHKFNRLIRVDSSFFCYFFNYFLFNFYEIILISWLGHEFDRLI